LAISEFFNGLLGLGSCRIQVRNRMHDEQVSAGQYIQHLLGIPEHIEVESIVAIGYPAERRAPLSADKLKRSNVHVARF
jgi:nitroreductase